VVRLALGLAALVLGSAYACSSSEHPPAFDAEPGSNGGGSGARDGGVIVEPEDGSTSGCGGEVIPAVSDPPALYFVLDRSGSMNDAFGANGTSKYDTARGALRDVLLAIGHRVRYGAAVFPAIASSDGCTPGRQVFPTTLGDSPTYAEAGRSGPVLSDFLRRLGYAEGEGGTPTAQTIAELAPTLVELGPRTHLVLATDGAPNCNEEAECDVGSCSLNIEGLALNGGTCEGARNCCDPEIEGDGAQRYCVDSEPLIGEVAKLAELGVPTYVIGMPGAEAYGDVLDRLAVAGGTARDGTPSYYDASDTEALTEALYAIGTGVAISCSIELESTPDDPGLVNLYFDGRVVLADPEEGWAWTGERSLEVRGTPCDELKSGSVYQAEVVFGCETEVPR
jgi:hypothetical protein